MSATFATIRTAIKTILDGISELSFVYTFHQSDIGGYPAVTFDVSDSTNDFLTNAENLRAFTFLIVIYQEVKNIGGLENATTLLDTVADKIIDAFEKDLTLGGVVEWSNPLTGPRQAFDTPQGLVITQQLSLQCNVVALVE